MRHSHQLAVVIVVSVMIALCIGYGGLYFGVPNVVLIVLAILAGLGTSRAVGAVGNA